MNKSFSMSRTYKRIHLRILGILIIAGVLFALASCRKQIPSAPRILKEGDNLNGMLVTSGTQNAPPLEAFCSLEIDEDVTDTINCQVPPLTKLQIGHMIGLKSDRFQALDWSKLAWQVYLDGYQLDLKTFAQQSYAEPVILSAPSPIREVFKQGKTWDIVLIHPTFGLHTLLCTVKTESVGYSWVVNFRINSTSGPASMVDQPTDARSSMERKPTAGKS